VEDDGIEPLGATLLVMPTGLQPAIGNILQNTLTTRNPQSISKLCLLIKNVCIKALFMDEPTCLTA
jgi:hypothetical protein